MPPLFCSMRVFIPRRRPPAPKPLSSERQAVQFVNEAFMHFKPIAAGREMPSNCLPPPKSRSIEVNGGKDVSSDDGVVTSSNGRPSEQASSTVSSRQ